MSRNFNLVKENVDIVDAALRYGIKVNRYEKACCPWHTDETPSLSFYNNHRRFHCFGCGADGDVIDLVCRQRNLTPLDAVRELNQVYRLGLDLDAPTCSQNVHEEIRKRNWVKEQKELFEVWEKSSFLIFCAYFRALREWRKLAPKSPDEIPDFRFVESLHQMDYIDYLLKEVFLQDSQIEKAKFMRTHETMIRAIEQRLIRGGVPYAGRTWADSRTIAPFWPVVIEGGPRSDRVA